MSPDSQWAYAELERKLAAQEAEREGYRRGEIHAIPEYGTLYLFDPAAREKLDAEIRDLYFPSVIEGLRWSRIRVFEAKNVLTGISDKLEPVAARELVFLLQDPPRPPAGPGSPAWYVRGTIHCSLTHCMITFELILGLPLGFPVEPVLDLMGDGRMRGDSPRLSIDYRMSGKREYVLHFTWGRGSSAGTELVINKGIKKHLAIIHAADQLEEQWDSCELFSALSAKIIAMYGEDDSEQW